MKELMSKVTKSDIRNILAITITFGCFVLLYVMIIKEVPKENKDLLNITSGFVFAGLSGVIGYYFGSSKNEADKEKSTRED